MFRCAVRRLSTPSTSRRWNSLNGNDEELVLASDPDSINKYAWKLDRDKEIVKATQFIASETSVLDMDNAAGMLKIIPDENPISIDEKNIEKGDTITSFVILRKPCEKTQPNILMLGDIATNYSRLPSGKDDNLVVAIRSSDGGVNVGYGFWQKRLKKCFVFLWVRGARSRNTKEEMKTQRYLTVGRQFWFSRFYRALEFRQSFIDFERTDCFRLIDGDVDGCPALTVDLLRTSAHIVINDQIAVSYLPYLIEYMQTRTPCTSIYCNASAKKITIPKQYSGYIGVNEGLRTQKVTENGLLFNFILRNVKHNINPGYRSWREAIEEFSSGRDCVILNDDSGSSPCYALRGGANKVLIVNNDNVSRKLSEDNINLNFHREEVRANHLKANQGFAYHFPNIERQHAYAFGTPRTFFQRLDGEPFDYFAFSIPVSSSSLIHTAVSIVVKALRLVRVNPDLGNTGIVLVRGVCSFLLLYKEKGK